MTFTCDIKIDLISDEPNTMRCFLETSFVVQLFDYFTFGILHIIDNFTLFDILKLDLLLSHTQVYFSFILRGTGI